MQGRPMYTVQKATLASASTIYLLLSRLITRNYSDSGTQYMAVAWPTVTNTQQQ